MTAEPTVPHWQPLKEAWTAERAEHAYVPGYELIVMQLAADREMGWKAEISWEVYGGEKFLDQISTGVAATFDDAKAKVVAEWRAVIGEKL